MRVARGSRGRRCGHCAGRLAAFALAIALVGCGGAPESTQAMSVQGRTPDARAVAAAAVSSRADPALSDGKSAPFELVGTSINATNTFAILKEADQRLRTVRAGDRIDGYTIAAIEPASVRVSAPGSAEQILVATGGPVAPMTPTDTAPPAPAAGLAGLITEGINTDQSMPEHITFGPTGTWPEGMKQMGH